MTDRLPYDTVQRQVRGYDIPMVRLAGGNETSPADAGEMSANSPVESQRGPARELVKHTLIYGSGYIAMAAASLVLIPLYTHYLSPSQFGLLALLLVFYGLCKQVYDLGFMNSVGRFFFDCKGLQGDVALRQMRSTSVLFMLTYGAILTAILWVFAGECAHLLTGDPANRDLVRIVALTLYADALTIVPLTLIRMQERSGLYVLITLLRFAATLILSIIFVAVLEWGVRGALIGSAIPTALVLAVLLPDYAIVLRARPSRALLRRMLAFGLPFFPVLLSVWVIDASDRYLIELFRSRDEVGWYSLAYRIGAVMQIGVAAFSMGWAPLRYKIYDRPDAKAVYRRLATFYVLAASLIGVGLALLAEVIVAAVAPATYAPAADVVALIVLSYALYGMYLMMVTGMGVTKKTAPMAAIAVAGAVVNVGLNLLLIPRWGMQAAAGSTAFAYVIMVGGAWWYSQRAYPIAYDWQRIGRIVLMAVAAVVAAGLTAPAGTVAAAAWGLAAWLVFVAALVITRAVPREEVTILREWTGRARVRVLRAVARGATIR
ncbi:MAG: oligosaccharide flippase family protein [Solirubrobacteraceae bacterium]